MKNLFIVANWKANKTEEEALLWFKNIEEGLSKHTIDFEHKEIVVCPSVFLLPILSHYIRTQELPMQLGSQDISQFGRGPYTGEVPASLLHKYIRFCLIGHSERRKLLHEDDKILEKKADIAVGSIALPIFCVESHKQKVPEGIKIVAYEPVGAIGTGSPDTPENARIVAATLKEKYDIPYVLYGGSVTSQNVKSFTSMPSIDGVLVGGASLDPLEFLKVVENA